MKKTGIFLLLALVIFTFTSCKRNNKNYEKGTITSTTYESEFLNLKFTAPEGYTIKIAEDGAVSAADIVNYFDSPINGRIKSSDVYEMEATTAITDPIVAVTVEKLPDPDMTIDEYAKTVMEASVTEEEYTIAGEDYVKLTIMVPLIASDIFLEEYCRIQDGYLVSIMIQYTSDTASQKDMLLNAFTKLE